MRTVFMQLKIGFFFLIAVLSGAAASSQGGRFEDGASMVLLSFILVTLCQIFDRVERHREDG